MWIIECLYTWQHVVRYEYKGIVLTLLGFSILTLRNFLLLMALKGMSFLDAVSRAMIALFVMAVYFNIFIYLFCAVTGYILWRYMGFEPDYTIYGVPMIDPVESVERMRRRHLATFVVLYLLFILPPALSLLYIV